MDALSEINKIMNEQQESSVVDSAKKSATVDASGTMASDSHTEILKGQGVDEVKKAGAATSKATPPGKSSTAAPKETLQKEEKEEDGKGKKKFFFGKKKDDADKKDDSDDSKKDSDKSDDDDSDDKSDKKDSKKKEDKKEVKESAEDIAKHIEAMFSGNEALSEDFRSKAATIFGAALSEKEVQIRTALTEEFQNQLDEQVEAIRTDLSEQVDSYLDYVVEQWVEQNQVEIERGLNQEIAESFMEGLRNLFLEHNIDVPEAKVDLVDDLAAKVAALEAKLNEEMNANVELVEKLDEYRKNELVAELGEDLSTTDFDRFIKLTESVSYENDEECTKSLKTIKESYFNKKGAPAAKKAAQQTVLSEGTTVDELEPSSAVGEDEVPQEITEQMNIYVQSVGKFGKR